MSAQQASKSARTSSWPYHEEGKDKCMMANGGSTLAMSFTEL